VWTSYLVLAHFNHLSTRFRQFRDLVDFDQLSAFGLQISLAVTTFLRSHIDHLVGLCNKFTLMLGMPSGRSMFAPATVFRQVALLIARRWLGRILRSRRRLLVALELQFQRFMISLQLLKGSHKPGLLFEHFLDQMDQKST
jgi:hypothetical protein